MQRAFPPPSQEMQISIQQIIEFRMAYAANHDLTPTAKEIIEVFDLTILAFAKSLTPNLPKGN